MKCVNDSQCKDCEDRGYCQYRILSYNMNTGKYECLRYKKVGDKS